MPTNKPLLPVKADFVFKLIFGDQRNADILAGFLKSVLDIPEEEYELLTIVDPFVKKESETDKYGILDVKLHTKSGQVVHVEVQLWSVPEMKERSIYYQSKMVTEQMASGHNYANIKRVVSIIITDFDLLPGKGAYHRQFRYRDRDGAEFTDLAEINTLELSKLPPEAGGAELWYWMKFIKSDDGEVLEMLAQKSPQLKKAVGVLKELSEDERNRMILEEREKARRDIESMLGGAWREGRREGRQEGRQEGSSERAHSIASSLLAMKMPMSQIVQATSLTRAEIEKIWAEIYK